LFVSLVAAATLEFDMSFPPNICLSVVIVCTFFQGIVCIFCNLIVRNLHLR